MITLDPLVLVGFTAAPVISTARKRFTALAAATTTYYSSLGGMVKEGGRVGRSEVRHSFVVY